MRRVGRQAQLVYLLPGANTDIGRIERGTLLGQFPLPSFGALVLLLCEALGGSPDEVGYMGRHRSSTGYTRSARGGLFSLRTPDKAMKERPAAGEMTCAGASTLLG